MDMDNKLFFFIAILICVFANGCRSIHEKSITGKETMIKISYLDDEIHELSKDIRDLHEHINRLGAPINSNVYFQINNQIRHNYSYENELTDSKSVLNVLKKKKRILIKEVEIREHELARVRTQCR